MSSPTAGNAAESELCWYHERWGTTRTNADRRVLSRKRPDQRVNSATNPSGYAHAGRLFYVTILSLSSFSN